MFKKGIVFVAFVFVLTNCADNGMVEKVETVEKKGDKAKEYVDKGKVYTETAKVLMK